MVKAVDLRHGDDSAVPRIADPAAILLRPTDEEAMQMGKRIEQIRTSMESNLDTLQAHAEAFKAQFGLSKEKRAERIKQQKQALRESLDRLRAEIRRRQDFADAKKQQVATAIDELKVQLSLGKAETGQAIETQRKNINAAIRRFESESERLIAGAQPRFDAAARGIIRNYAQARDALKSELEAAVKRLQFEAAHQGTALAQRRRELSAKIAELQKQLANQRKRLGDRFSEFETELRPGLEQIARAFEKLFG